jgi:ribosomal protein S18 acetylase RimI-like enzyme
LSYVIRNFTRDDIPQIVALQKAYQAVNPKTVVLPGETYLSPVFDEGRNIFCAFDESGKLSGYAAIAPNISETDGVPHTLWSIVKVDPALKSPRPLLDMLFDKVVARSQEILSSYPGDEARLMFQHQADETDVIAFLKSRGCEYLESIFHMMYDLAIEPALYSEPIGVETRDLKMDDIPELQFYITARNECFPTHATNLREWQYFFNTILGGKGKVIAAFDKGEIAGSVLVYWNEDINRQLGIDMGQTEYVFVKESWRNQGIAAGMICLGLKYFKEQGLKFGHLEVRADNENALKLYMKTGYKKAGEEQFYYFKLE